jgi:hypothetical protein
MTWHRTKNLQVRVSPSLVPVPAAAGAGLKTGLQGATHGVGVNAGAAVNSTAANAGAALGKLRGATKVSS